MAAARARCISSSFRPVSAKNAITVWLAGSLPFTTSAFGAPVGKVSPCRGTRCGAGPVEGSDASHCSTIGTTSASVNAPAMKNVKSAALANRSR